MCCLRICIHLQTAQHNSNGDIIKLKGIGVCACTCSLLSNTGCVSTYLESVPLNSSDAPGRISPSHLRSIRQLLFRQVVRSTLLDFQQDLRQALLVCRSIFGTRMPFAGAESREKDRNGIGQYNVVVGTVLLQKYQDC